MADNKVSMPSGFGGLLKFNEETESKLSLKPTHVVIMIILVVAIRIALPFIFS